KIDKIKDKSLLLPLIDLYRKEYEFAAILPVSGLKGNAVDDLLDQIVTQLPEGDPIFAQDELTDQPMRVLIAEMVREKILETTGEEIPYVTAVVTEVYDETDPGLLRIFCAIYVERASQKKIIIGKQGSRLKDVGTKARLEFENLSGQKVFLKLFVKVVEDWRNREQALDELGLDKR